jgi:hypothetical protein
VVPAYQGRADSESGFRADLYQSAKAMNGPVHPAIRHYAAGEISASKAADMLGERATVADVFVMTRQAGLPLPRQSPKQEQAELKHALKVLGLE